MSEVVAILIPVYNAVSTICTTLESIRRQTAFRHNGGNLRGKLVLVNNNSTDGTFESEAFLDVLKKLESLDGFEETSILFCREAGIVPALNTGVFEILSLRNQSGNSKYNFIARLDADDIWEDDKLAKQFAFLQKHPDVSVLGTGLTLVNKAGEEVGALIHPVDDFAIKKSLMSGINALAHPSVIIQTDLFRRSGVYDPTFPFAEDLHLWLKALPWYKFANLEEKLTRYTVSHNPNYNGAVAAQLSTLFKAAYSTFSYKA